MDPDLDFPLPHGCFASSEGQGGGRGNQIPGNRELPVLSCSWHF